MLTANQSSEKRATTTPLVKGKILGKGSYGTVFQAHVGNSNEVVAVKATSILPCALSLLKEKNILKSCSCCPEIVQCYGSQITIENGAWVQNLVLEYAPYGTLAGLTKKGAFLESQVREYTRMLLRGLSCIHNMGLVHCDLKPKNILVFPSSSENRTPGAYQLKIADFGLAKTLEEKKNFDAKKWQSKFTGTPLYMSPESISLGRIEPALDIWSLGCIVVEMITGLPPWWSCQITSVNEFLYRLIFQGEAPKIPNSVSKDCKDFLSKCFDRYYNWIWTAEMLLQHPFLAPPKRRFY